MGKKWMDKSAIAKGVELILDGLELDRNSEGLKDTAARVADFYSDFFAGLKEDPKASLKLYHAENRDELIIARDISFFSICEHHLLPFFGRVHLAYIPENDTITGFARLVRVVELISRRLQIQERMTTQIADTLTEVLHPKGVLVVVEAEQLCLTMRGLRQPGIMTISSAVRGDLRNDATRQEALILIKSNRD